MSIRINSDTCVGCLRCSAVCPGTLIAAGEDKKAYIRYPEDCWGCASCVKECEAGAIAFYLAEDMGGDGTWMRVKQDGSCLDWEFYRDSVKIRTIRVDRTASNRY